MVRLSSDWRSVIPQVQARLPNIAYDIVDHVLGQVESRAAARAPIGATGHLAASIAKQPTRRTGHGAEGETIAGAEYAAYVNYGTGQRGAASMVPGRGGEIRYSAGWKGMPAQPFMSQAAEQAKEEWDDAWRKVEKDLPRL